MTSDAAAILAILDERLGLCPCKESRHDPHDVAPPCERSRIVNELAALDAPADEPWCVYEWATGVIFTVRDHVKARAEDEARLVGTGHEAMLRREADQLRQAHINGWSRRLEQVRADGDLVMPDVTRAEHIGPDGRVAVTYTEAGTVRLAVQDNGRTLKVLITPKGTRG